jgi:hypothetical protein
LRSSSRISESRGGIRGSLLEFRISSFECAHSSSNPIASSGGLMRLKEAYSSAS